MTYVRNYAGKEATASISQNYSSKSQVHKIKSTITYLLPNSQIYLKKLTSISIPIPIPLQNAIDNPPKHPFFGRSHSYPQSCHSHRPNNPQPLYRTHHQLQERPARPSQACVSHFHSHRTSTHVTYTLYSLKKASIIPDIVDDFHPKCFILPTYGHGKHSQPIFPGKKLKVSKTKEKPSLKVYCPDMKSTTGLTIALTDPDAPSRGFPKLR